MTCSACHQETDSPRYNTRYCGCWKECEHPICEACDVWRDNVNGDEWEEVE